MFSKWWEKIQFKFWYYWHTFKEYAYNIDEDDDLNN